MDEAERIEMPEETSDADHTPQETGPEAIEAAQQDAEAMPGADTSAESSDASDDEAAVYTAESQESEAEGMSAHALSGATLEAMSRTDPQALAVAEAERTKWERRKAFVSESLHNWCRQYMADGGFKLGIALVTAIIAAAIIVIAGIFSDRQLGVVFWRAVIGFFVSGVFMGGTLYWLDRIGIPLFIAKHEEQIQMDWLAEAEEPETGEEEGEPAEEEAEPGELEELMPQEDDASLQEGEETASEEVEVAEEETQEGSEATEADSDSPAERQEEDGLSEEQASEESSEEQQAANEEGEPGEDIEGLENAVLDDAFSSGTAEDEPEKPPTFAPMTAENLETLSVPES